MVDFIKVRRRQSYRDRMRRLRQMLNQSEFKQLSLAELNKAWQLTPTYVRKLMQWCASQYENIHYDPNYDVIYLTSELSPAYRRNHAQQKLVI